MKDRAWAIVGPLTGIVFFVLVFISVVIAGDIRDYVDDDSIFRTVLSGMQQEASCRARLLYPRALKESALRTRAVDLVCFFGLRCPQGLY